MAKVNCSQKECPYGSSPEKCNNIFENQCKPRVEKNKQTCSFCAADEFCEQKLKLCPTFSAAVKKIGL